MAMFDIGCRIGFIIEIEMFSTQPNSFGLEQRAHCQENFYQKISN